MQVPAQSWALRTPPRFPRILPVVEGARPLLRMCGWLGVSGLYIFGYWYRFGCLVVICRVISRGAWLNAFSRMAAPRVPFCIRHLPPLGGLRPTPSGDA